ncbi:MAG: class IV adenylate cyclase [Gemmataceae bacterium]
MLEVEQKFRVADPAAVRNALAERRFQHLSTLLERDEYLKAPDRDFAQSGEALRIRQSGEQLFFTYKGPKQSGAVKIRPEIELPISLPPTDLEQVRQFWLLLGYKPVRLVEKTRELYQHPSDYTGILVTLDTVRGIGSFSEIECVVEAAEAATATLRIQALAIELGFDQPEPRSYLRMVLEAEGQQ